MRSRAPVVMWMFAMVVLLLGRSIDAQPIPEPPEVPAVEVPPVEVPPAPEQPAIPVAEPVAVPTADSCLAELDGVEAAIQEEDPGRALVLLDMARDACNQARQGLLAAATSTTAPDLYALLTLWRMEMRRSGLMAALASCEESRRILRDIAAEVDLPVELHNEFAQVAYNALRCGPRAGEPTGGTLSAYPGFADIAVSGTTVSEQEAYLISDYCAGYIPRSPNYALTVSEAMQLSITAYSYMGADLVLLVTDGTTTFCNDDWDGLNPGLSEFFPAGTYSIYIGEYSASGMGSDFTLNLTSMSLVPSAYYPSYGSAYVGPGYGRTTLSGTVWGVNEASTVFDPTMTGWIASDPDFQLYVEGSGEVWINVTGASGTDLTLIVDGAGGRYFNDDAMGTNPAIHNVMTPGTYNVWVGDKAGSGTGVSYGIQFSSYDPLMTLGTEPTFGVATLGRGSAPVVLSGTSTGILPAADFFGSSCYGAVPANPSHRLVLSEDGMVEVVARSTYSGDLILVVSGPSGVFCNDDYEGLNPGIRRWMRAGEYLVYVGELSATPAGTAFATTFTSLGGTPPPDFTTYPAGTFGTVTVGSSTGATTLSGTSGGSEPAANIDPSCRGYISPQPSFLMDVTDYSSISVQVLAEGDTTLVIMGSDGTVYCNDDTVGLNPSISQYFNPGRFGVWVGSYSSTQSMPFMINFNPSYWY